MFCRVVSTVYITSIDFFILRQFYYLWQIDIRDIFIIKISYKSIPPSIKFFKYIFSDSIQSEQTRPSSENLPFSISRLLSKPYDNNNKTTEKDILDAEHKFATHLANVGIPYSTASALYSYPLYSAGHVLRVPPQRAPLSWSLPPLHPAALAHQAVKDRLAGKFLRL